MYAKSREFRASSWGFWLLIIVPVMLLHALVLFGQNLGWTGGTIRWVYLSGIVLITMAALGVALWAAKTQWPKLPLHQRLREFFRYNE